MKKTYCMLHTVYCIVHQWEMGKSDRTISVLKTMIIVTNMISVLITMSAVTNMISVEWYVSGSPKRS